MRKTSVVLGLSAILLATTLSASASTSTEAVGAAGQPVGSNRLISRQADGQSTIDDSYDAVISANGRFVVFASEDRFLVEGEVLPAYQLYLFDRQTGATSLVSRGFDGKPGDEPTYSFWPDISADGTWIVFNSVASNLVPDDDNDEGDVFLHNRVTGSTVLISRDVDGEPAGASNFSARPAISADGSTAAYPSSQPNLVDDDPTVGVDAFRYKVATGETELVSRRNDGAPLNDASGLMIVDVSGNGRWVTYNTRSPAVLPGDSADSNDIFLVDAASGRTSLASSPDGGGWASGDSFAATISSDGRYVAFSSDAPEFGGTPDRAGQVVVRDTATRTSTIASLTPEGEPARRSSYQVKISPDGTHVLFHSLSDDLVEGDTNHNADIFVRDLVGGTTVRATLRNDGSEIKQKGITGGSLSRDGHLVVFAADMKIIPRDDNEAVDVYLHRIP